MLPVLAFLFFFVSSLARLEEEHTSVGVLIQQDAEDGLNAISQERRLAGKSQKLTNKDIKRLLGDHNNYRKRTKQGKTPGQPKAKTLPKLKWDKNLAKFATNYAKKCRWAHNPNNKKYGENLGMSFSGNSNAPIPSNAGSLKMLRGLIKAWYNEYKYYNYNTGGCKGVCGHYTQVVWAKSRKIGCGYAICRVATNPSNGQKYYSATLLVCNYSPPGNYVGQKPYPKKGGAAGAVSGAQAQAPQSASSEPKAGGDSKGIGPAAIGGIIGGICTVCILVGMCVWFGMNKKKKMSELEIMEEQRGDYQPPQPLVNSQE